MWITRNISENLQRLAKQRPCVALLGARQTGKSSLLQRLFPDYTYITLDLPSKALEARENGERFLEKHPPPVIIDEIQYAPELFSFLKIQIDQNRHLNGHYLLTGSQKFSLMENISETLSGRISLLQCHSLSLEEILGHKGQRPTTKNILKWIVQGGYPEVYAKQLSPEEFYGDYMATYLERDVRNILNVKDLSRFNHFMHLLALRSGQVLNMNTLSGEVGVHATSVKKWISVLETSNIIYLLKPFYRNYGKRLRKAPKVYFLDTGLLCFLVNISKESMLEKGPFLGAFFETLILGQFVKNFAAKARHLDLYYFRDNHGLEIDFVIPNGHKLHLYECKFAFRPGQLPKNVTNFINLVGKENIASTYIVSGHTHDIDLGDNRFVTGPLLKLP